MIKPILLIVGIIQRIKDLWQFIPKRKNIIFFFFVVLILISIAIGIVNILDYKVDFLNINPHDNHIYKYIDLYYPQSSSVGPIVQNFPSQKISNQPLFNVHILLSYDGDLIEGKEVDVIAVGYANPDGQKLLAPSPSLNRIISYEGQKIDTKYLVIAGINGAEQFNEFEGLIQFSRGQFPVEMNDNNDPLHRKIFRLTDYENFSKMHNSIVWNTEGDYSPYIVFIDSNETLNVIQFPDYKIHVSGSEVEKQERYSRINTSLTIALFCFTIIQIMLVLRDINPTFFSKLLGNEPIDENLNPTLPMSGSQQSSNENRPQNLSTKHKKKP